MNINVEVLCNECKNCNNFEIEQTNFYTGDKVYDRAFTCKHFQQCFTALRIWEKQNETN